MDKTLDKITVVELTEYDDVYDQPLGINIDLKTHQKVILGKCIDIENNYIIQDESYIHTNIGILADCVGSGKSYVILSLIYESRNKTKHYKEIKTYGNNKVIVTRNLTHSVNKSLNASIIIVPHNIFSQWQNYINVFGGNMNSIFISRTANINAFKEMGFEKIQELDIILTTCSFYNDLQAHLKKYEAHVRRIVIDEADNINITMSEEVENSFIWFVTASFKNLIHPHGLTMFDKHTGKYVDIIQGIKKPGFMKNIFTSMVNMPPKLYSSVILKNSDNFVNSCLELPKIQHYIIKCYSPFYIRVLHGIVENCIIDKLNAMDIDSVVRKITYNKGTENNIIDMFVESYETEKSNLNAKLKYTIEMQNIYKDSRTDTMDKIKKRISVVESKIISINDRIKSTNTCFICYDTIKKKTVLKCCQNSICLNCINLWMNTNPVCPICKSELNFEKLFVIEEDKRYDVPNEQNTKLENLNIILNQINTRQDKSDIKILIFSTYENSFERIIEVVEGLKMTYSFLKGNQNFINKTINEYNNGSINILLINPSYYGSGLNLEATSDIIMFHKFDSEIEKQVVGRAQRPGRKKSLNLYYLLHENELHDLHELHELHK